MTYLISTIGLTYTFFEGNPNDSGNKASQELMILHIQLAPRWTRLGWQDVVTEQRTMITLGRCGEVLDLHRHG